MNRGTPEFGDETVWSKRLVAEAVASFCRLTKEELENLDLPMTYAYLASLLGEQRQNMGLQHREHRIGLAKLAVWFHRWNQHRGAPLHLPPLRLVVTATSALVERVPT